MPPASGGAVGWAELGLFKVDSKVVRLVHPEGLRQALEEQETLARIGVRIDLADAVCHLGLCSGEVRSQLDSGRIQLELNTEMDRFFEAVVQDDEDLEEGVFGGKDYEKMAKGKKGSYAPDPEAGEKDYTPTPEEAAQARAADKARGPTSSRDKFPRRHSGGGGGMKLGGITAEGQDELVEQITKRVAARILKAALSKK